MFTEQATNERELSYRPGFAVFDQPIEIGALVCGLPEKAEPAQSYRGKLVELHVPGYDVYNCTQMLMPSETGLNMPVIFARVEERNTEQGSRVFAFFRTKSGEWIPMDTGLRLQDPAVCVHTKQIILSGVNVEWNEAQDGKERTCTYWTEFYSLDMSTLQPSYIGRGPDNMKDIRLFVSSDGNGENLVYHVLTRPHVDRGRIGRVDIPFSMLASDKLPQILQDAPLLPIDVEKDKWIGGNQGKENGRYERILAHKAAFVGTDREYVITAVVYDNVTERCSQMKVIATRADFPPTDAKRPDLENVTFSGGFIENDDGTITIFAGLSDASVGEITIQNPFIDLEHELELSSLRD